MYNILTYTLFLFNKEMVTKKEFKFVKYFFGTLFLIIGLLGTILPIMPGLIFISVALVLLEDIPFFNDIKLKMDNRIQVSIRAISKRYKHEKEIIT